MPQRRFDLPARYDALLGAFIGMRRGRTWQATMDRLLALGMPLLIEEEADLRALMQALPGAMAEPLADARVDQVVEWARGQRERFTLSTALTATGLGGYAREQRTLRQVGLRLREQGFERRRARVGNSSGKICQFWYPPEQ